mmetsp:Transcript_30944/g.45316  ORF Transcript_30944/g.45316 Transcript_30944/m.45316 type:complete len:416 (-) Transcript_30944:237-1484(-)|eukprot:CAMPEP_0116021354 /NCGR_PEP_ID=MMETSP0321-20121206/10339_1 /TAXON_ID=163516 /ORGANISM="Leptocylindrus danicus var. danicus, Strain B650" /LENGTH=415 /DNA_ID=CAMNT_0003492213 /DNA_START=376 /DNA_END=1623 /DNA_ORIENTATION=+
MELNVKITPDHDDILVHNISRNKSIFPSAEDNMLDYEFVEKCTDKEVMCNILLTLKEGKHGRYPHLEQTVREKMFHLLEPFEKQKIVASAGDNGVKNDNTHDHLSNKRDVCDELGEWLVFMNAYNDDCQGEKDFCVENSLNTPYSIIPPVRGLATSATVVSHKSSTDSPKQRKANPKETQRNNCISKENMSNRDYFRAWDKFDVEAAEAAIDAEDNPQDNIPDAKNDLRDVRVKRRDYNLKNLQKELGLDNLSVAERRSLALQEKFKGNEYFRCGENKDAVICYSKSIAYNGNDAVVHANRAMASIRLGNYEQATTDCAESLRIDPTYTKALARKAIVHHKRGQYDEASMDFKECMRREPESKEYTRLYTRSIQKLRETEGTRSIKIESCGTYKRVLIEEISSDDDGSIQDTWNA